MKTVDEILATLSFITIEMILRGGEYEETLDKSKSD